MSVFPRQSVVSIFRQLRESAELGKTVPVKVLIRDTAKKLYLGEQDSWVKAIGAGRDFVTCAAAITHLTVRRMKGVELYCSFPNSTFDFPLSLEAFDDEPKKFVKSARSAQK